MKKVSKEMIDEMKRLREQGLTYRKIAEKFNISQNTVQYHLNPKYKAKRIKNVTDWQNRNRQKILAYNRSWRRKNSDKFKKSICLSIIRSYLKRGIVTKEEILAVLRE